MKWIKEFVFWCGYAFIMCCLIWGIMMWRPGWWTSLRTKTKKIFHKE